MSVSVDQNHHQPYVNSAVREQRRRVDQRRMVFRRAIEDYAEQRELQHALSDYPDLPVSGLLARQLLLLPQNARPGC